MDDLVRLLAAFPALEKADQLQAVATVVNTRGSSYRRPGARMVIGSQGTMHGAVSAGCLERDIIAHCRSLGHEPVLLTYDGNSRDDLIFGLKLGCDGIVQILLESAASDSRYLARMETLAKTVPALLSSQKRVVAATIFSLQDSSGNQIFSVMGTVLVSGIGQSCALATLPETILAYLQDQSQKLLAESGAQSLVVRKNLDGFTVHALLEIVQASPRLVIFGSGRDVEPLREISALMGWQVILVGERRDIDAFIDESRCDAAAVMTHDYERDKSILAALFNSEASYIGVVGPRRRADKLLAELALAGVPITPAAIGRLYSPVGLDIGAERPEEIALAIVAEIKAVLASHGGGMLRHKQGPIHQALPQGGELAEGTTLNAICNL